MFLCKKNYKSSIHVKPLSEQIIFSRSCFYACNLVFVAFLLHSKSFHEEYIQRKNQYERSHCVSFYYCCYYYYYYYYYYYLLLFLHSFIALYKLTQAFSRFVAPPLPFFLYFDPSFSALSSRTITYPSQHHHFLQL
jgi:hypothetical protein